MDLERQTKGKEIFSPSQMEKQGNQYTARAIEEGEPAQRNPGHQDIAPEAVDLPNAEILTTYSDEVADEDDDHMETIGLQSHQTPTMASDMTQVPSSTTNQPAGSKWTKPMPYEILDARFKFRPKDYDKFFQAGQIFSILWTEPSSGFADIQDKSISRVVYGEKVHSRIRRFVVLSTGERACVCLPILNRITTGTRNIPVGSRENHGIIYSEVEPPLLQGTSAMSVRVTPVNYSRRPFGSGIIDYGRPYTVEMNLKVKAIAVLDPASTPTLVANFKRLFLDRIKDDRPIEKTPSQNVERPGDSGGQLRLRHSQGQGMQYLQTVPEKVVGPKMSQKGTSSAPSAIELAEGFVIIHKPNLFFAVGRIFKTLWTEPAGPTARESDSSCFTTVANDQLIFSEIRRFVVVRMRKHSCLCLPLSLCGEGLSEPEIRTQDHVPVWACERDYRPSDDGAEEAIKSPLAIILENRNERIEESTSINLGQVYTITHNMKVLKVGRMHPASVARLDKYFAASMMG